MYPLSEIKPASKRELLIAKMLGRLVVKESGITAYKFRGTIYITHIEGFLPPRENEPKK